MEYQNKNKEKYITKKNGQIEHFSIEKITRYLLAVADRAAVSIPDSLIKEITTLIVSYRDAIKSSRDIPPLLPSLLAQFFEEEPLLRSVAAKIMVESIVSENSTEKIIDTPSYEKNYRALFLREIEWGVYGEKLHPSFFDFDIAALANALVLSRDTLIHYCGMFTLCKRYFLKEHNKIIETPQAFWMRIAMGIAINEKEKTARAIEFYTVLSRCYYTPSTPTLFNAGLKKAQLSSCYVSMVDDDLESIFRSYTQSAQLVKWAGGVGMAWSKIRGVGAPIKSINATSSGLIPYLKIADDIIGTITKSGIRRGAICVYIEPWHLEVEEFIELRKNTGDHRRRTHDMSTSLWMNDLFFERVRRREQWTLFSPDQVPDLPSLYGKAFVEKYLFYEAKAKEGSLPLHRVVAAEELWKKILTKIFETGHPWITFKDACNIRSPQKHCGVVYSSNLCTEIVLNTSAEEIAVCNLGSINVSALVTAEGTIDWSLLRSTVHTAVRMLDNIIDAGFYPVAAAEKTNKKHRPIGLGITGMQDLMIALRIPYLSKEAEILNDKLGEHLLYDAITASSALAEERGAYETFPGSLWSQGIFPLDTLSLLAEERGMQLPIPLETTLPWNELKEQVKRKGMRNSNLISIAPTATISTIIGVYPSFEPMYKNLYVKSNTVGEFTVINTALVHDLKAQGLWTKKIRNAIKFYDGSLQKIPEIPEALKKLYMTAFEIPPLQLITLAALRGKWIDQSQSLNIFFNSTSGKELSEIYTAIYESGLKTSYYLKTLGSSQIEKATLDEQEYGLTQLRERQSCSMNSECESCQ